ncbi:hypothetical protein MTO96_051208 [Rhipicephalus appendiculatus]
MAQMERASEIILLAGNSHLDLAQKIADRLGIRVGNCTVVHSANRETLVDIGESVRSRDVYIIQTGSKDVNNSIMEMLIMAYCCKTSCARKIVGVIPYLPYGKQSKMRKRGCIVSKLLAQMLVKAGLTHIITMWIFTRRRCKGSSTFLLTTCEPHHSCCSTSPNVSRTTEMQSLLLGNPSTANKATSYAERLRLGIAVIHGEQKESESDMVDGRYSPPTVLMPGRTMEAGLDLMPVPAAKEKPPIYVVGDVGGRIAIMVDDMVDDVQSFVVAAEVLKERGAYKIYVLATHGLLSSDAPQLIENSPIDEVVVTNTVPHEVQKMQCHKIKTVDISVLLSEAIRRIHHKESMSYLFRNVTLED